MALLSVHFTDTGMSPDRPHLAGLLKILMKERILNNV